MIYYLRRYLFLLPNILFVIVALMLSSAQPVSAQEEKAFNLEAASHLSLADELRQKGNLKGAEEQLRLAIESDPKSVYLKVELGEVLYEQRKYSDVIDLLAPLAELAEDEKLLEILANSYIRNGKLDEGFERYKQLADIRQDDFQLQYRVGTLLAQHKRYREAANYFRRSADLQPDVVDVFYNLGLSYLKLNKNDQAKKEFEKALELDSNYILAITTLAQLAYEDEEWEQALEYYKRALKINPGNSPVFFRFADVSTRIDNSPDSAIEYINILLSENPDDRGLLVNVGLFYYQIRKVDKTVEYLSEAVEMGVQDFQTIYTLGLGYIAINKPKDALPYLIAATAFEAQEPSIWTNLGLTYSMLRQDRAALESYSNALKIDPENKQAFDISGRTAYSLVARTYLALEEFENALRMLDKAVLKSPNDFDNRYFIALSYFRLEQYETALNRLEKAQQLDEKNAQVYSLRGAIYRNMGQNDLEIEEYKKSLGILPEDQNLLIRLADAYNEIDDKDNAEKYLKELLAIDPDNASALNYLGYLWAEQAKNLEEAKEMIERALEKDPNNGAYIDSLAWVFFQLGETEKALEEMKKSVALVQNDPVIYDHLGDVYFKLGEKKLATEAWRKSLEVEDKEEVRKKLEQIEEDEDMMQ